MGKAHNDSQKINAKERAVTALKLRRAGFGYREIADQLGVSVGAAHKYVAKAMKQLNDLCAEEAEQIKQMELDRLDRLQAGIWSEATKGKLQAIDRCIKIMQHRADLLGIKAPTKHANTTPDGEEAGPTVIAVPVPAQLTPEEWLQIFGPKPSN